MKFLKTDSTSIYENLALEEYLFEHEQEEDCLLLWKNDESIVLGKYQNIYEEVNVPELERRGIPAARRGTGGGTVFHDMGNLNYSYITRYDPGRFSEYDDFITPLIRTLNRLGVPAEKKNHSDVVVEGKKISGSAQTIRKGRILHHGTLLFDADLFSLKELLRPTEGNIQSKAVKSVRSSVTNIKRYFQDKSMNLEKLETCLLEGLAEGRQREELTLGSQDLAEIKRLAEEKYETWDWNFGKSPDFTFQRTSRDPELPAEIWLKVSKGRIEECRVKLDSPELPADMETRVEQAIEGARYSWSLLKEILQSAAGSCGEKLATYFF